jgi:hypothetical protein
MRRVPLLFCPVVLCLVALLPAQRAPVNLDFQQIAIEGKPPGWSWTADPSYAATILEDCRTPNTRCVLFHSRNDYVPSGSGMFLQSFDASAFRGKQVRFRAWLRAENLALSGAQLFLRVDRPSGSGFSGYSPRQKTDSIDWTMHEVVGKIDPDADRITIGMMLSGMGAAAIADARLDTLEGPG